MTDVPTPITKAPPVAPEAPLPSRAAQQAEPPARASERKKPRKRVAAAKAAPKKHRRSIRRRLAFNNPAPKNPNRPLELKTALTTVLALLPGMKKPEVEVFASAMSQLQALSRSGRRRVLTALGQVYP